jgi:hypothetical protein
MPRGKTTREERRAALATAKLVPVPARFAHAAFEWREGYAHGLAGSSRACPVSEQPWEMKDYIASGTPTRREAWKDGRDKGHRKREREARRG